MDIIFLTTDTVLHVHEAQIALFGGVPGVRDHRLLESAVLAPQATFGSAYLHTDIFAMATAYMHGIIKNHPFFDGNKRTGISTGLVFLRLNEVYCHVSIEELVKLGTGIASSKHSMESIAEQLRAKCH